MSSTVRYGELNASALPIISRFNRASPAKFSSSASIAVSKVCNRDVSAAPAIAVIVGGLFLITVWRVWFEDMGGNLTAIKLLPPWPLSPEAAEAGLALRFLGSRLKYLAPLWQVILYDYGVTIAARFLGVSPSLVYAYVERKQIPHYRMMGRSIRFRLSELAEWRQPFHVNGGIDEQQDR